MAETVVKADSESEVSTNLWFLPLLYLRYFPCSRKRKKKRRNACCVLLLVRANYVPVFTVMTFWFCPKISLAVYIHCFISKSHVGFSCILKWLLCWLLCNRLIPQQKECVSFLERPLLIANLCAQWLYTQGWCMIHDMSVMFFLPHLKTSHCWTPGGEKHINTEQKEGSSWWAWIPGSELEFKNGS